VLEAGVEALGVLPDDDDVDAGVLWAQLGDDARGAEADVEVERLAERDVRAREPLADRRRDRALDADRLRRSDSRSALGTTSPVSSMARVPATWRSQVTRTPAASTTRVIASVISGPIPSPGRSVMV
jgi:hypothetical protein